MARTTRAPSLQSRDGRLRLPDSTEVHWHTIHEGLAIGYRRGARGGTWWTRRRHGTRYLKARLGVADDIQDADGVTVLDYKQAHRRALEFSDAEPEDGRKPVVASGYTVGDCMRDYLEHFTLHAKSQAQTKKVIDAHIVPALESRPVEALTTRELSRWHQKLVTAPIRLRGKKATRAVDPNDPEAMRKRKATANRVLTVLKAALNHAYNHGRVKSADAWKRVKPFRGVDAPKVRYLTEDECTRLINACPADLRELVRGALHTGCRFGELAKMQTGDYNPDAGTVTVREAKGGKARHVPLTEDGQALFDRLTAGRKGADLIFTRADGNPWAKDWYQRPLRQACAVAEIEPAASFHVLRHTYGSLLAMAGVPLQVIAAAMGHADLRMTTRHYAHLSPDFVADTIRAHLPSFGGASGKVRRIRSKHPRRAKS